MSSRIFSALSTIALVIALLSVASPAHASAISAQNSTASSHLATSALNAHAATFVSTMNKNRVAAKKKAYKTNATIQAYAQSQLNAVVSGKQKAVAGTVAAALPKGWRSSSNSFWGPVSGTATTLANAYRTMSITTGDFTDIGVGWGAKSGKSYVYIIVAKYLPPQKVLSSTEKKTATNTLFVELNKTRTSQKKSAIALDPQLTQVAQKWADTMAASTTMKHNPNLATQSRTGWQRLAENVVMQHDMNYVAMNKLWVNSPGHYRNMLGDHTHVGTAVQRSSDGRLWGVQVFAHYGSQAKAYTTAQIRNAQKIVRSQVSSQRRSAGKSAYSSSASLDAVAQAWAQHQAVTTVSSRQPGLASALPRGSSASHMIVSVADKGDITKAAWRAVNGANLSQFARGFTHVGVGAARSTRDGRVYVSVVLAKYPTSVKL